jgi:type IV secretion system protein TrbI
MPISHKPILAPDPPNPRVPLRRSTFIVLVVLALSVAFGLSLLAPGSGPVAGESSGATAGAPPVHFGKQHAIDDELTSALDRAVAPPIPQQGVGAAGSPRTAASEAPLHDAAGHAHPLRHLARPVALAERGLPMGVLPHDSSTGAVPPDAVGDAAVRLEHEARVRMAKALAHDFSEPVATHRIAPDESGRAAASFPQGPPAATPIGSAARRTPYWAPQVPGPGDRAEAASDAMRPHLEALRLSTENASDPAAPGARGQAAWLRDYAAAAGGPRPAALHARDNPHELVLLQGKVIPAVLTRDLVSDLPGRLSARVSAPVYDSLGRGALLIPMGSLLVGSYDSGIAQGQTRLMMAFERLVLPDGRSFDLPAAPGSDLAGAAGATGRVDHHFLRKFSSALFIAVLADRFRQPAQVTQLGGTGLPTAAGQVLVDVSRGVLDQNRGIPPTLTIPAGTRIHVEVTSDMAFARAAHQASPP